ncbi:histidine triad nucleotide-binding protein [candidate division KSB1 bacterium]
MIDCVFCKVVTNEIPSEKVYEDDDMVFFKDITPQAPVHLLGIPKKHIVNINDLKDEDAGLIAKIFLRIRELVKEYPELSKGYRVVTNSGKESGQSVFHMHIHVIGGRYMGWPPG